MWASEVDLRSLLGSGRAETFIKAFAGQRVYIPARARKDHPIADAVGINGMAVLCRKYGLDSICVPNAFRNAPSKDRIVERLNAGASNAEIVREIGVTLRYVQLLRKQCTQTTPGKR